ncbi:hypothetical protein [Mucilaginibacter sp. BT774]|uniref:hypothetical protein n=1 Tax=Mucilaginibacter sp. BT774 TaxID=3062276 RepID=UPI0026759030|nr:hypothetical protein [Mucilaginibacter sp. BT774]MDO3628861.1 hypothetical protein [Mucilaginibacter sp. BT774]
MEHSRNNFKIYRVTVDVSNYQWIMPNIPEDDLLEFVIFDCNKKDESWIKTNWYVYNLKEKKGNFFEINGGALAFDQQVYDSELFTLLEMAGEILPVNVGGERLYALNVLECINCLDQENSKFDYYDDGTKGRILKYAFHRRLTESSIFKIPETSRGEILTYSGVKDAEDEFYSLYKQLKFTGLKFEELYSK